MDARNNAAALLVIQLLDPGDVLSRPDCAAILDSQATLVATAVMEAGGETAVLEPDRDVLRWTATFPGAREALRAAVLIQQHAAGHTPTGPRLQMACGISLEGEADAEPFLFPHGGGRILVSEPAYESLDKPTQEAYEWKEPRHNGVRTWKPPWKWQRTSWRSLRDWWRGTYQPRLCFWDERFTLLNAAFERAFAMEVAGWVQPLRARRLEAAQKRRAMLQEVYAQRGEPMPELRPIDQEPPAELPFPERPHVENDLVGLGLGGGGMRAATFSLGVTQALARDHVLRDVDYIASVSGGGYLGMSLQALLAEELPYDDPDRFSLSRESFPFSFPRPGDPTAGTGTSTGHSVHGLESPALRYVREHARFLGRGIGMFDGYTWAIVGQVVLSLIVLWAAFLLPALALAALGGMLFREWFADQGTGVQRAMTISPLVVAVVAWVLTISPPGKGEREWQMLGRFAVGASVALAVLVVMAVVSTPSDKTSFNDAARVVAALSPLILFGFASLLVLGFEAARWRAKGVRRKERLRTISALTANYYSRLAGAVAAILAVVGLIALMENTVYSSDFTEEARAGVAAIQVGGLAVTIASIRKLVSDAEEAARSKAQSLLAKVAFLVAGYAVLAVTVALASWALWWLWTGGHDAWLVAIAVASGVLLVLVGLWGRLGFFALNWFAPHRLYAALIQASWIIGARQPGQGEGARVRQWFRVWNRPDLTLSSLRPAEDERPAAPYPVVCTTLNIPGTRDERMPDRSCESFVLGPVVSGSALTRWMPTEACRDIDRMPLASASALSGAAVSPAMGFRTNRTLGVALTLFNVRLGQWLDNPRRPDNEGWKRFFNQRPLMLYWKEMLGLATREDGHVYLSDGEHFEGLGVYELLRRRCRYIIAIAADTGKGVDKPVTFGKLASTLRLARVDFGVEVDFRSLQPLMRDSKNPEYVGSYFAAATIRYPHEDGHKDEGVLIVISCGMVEKGLPADILNYKNVTDPGFPYYSTADLQYDQPQFESLRQLGYLAGQAMARAGLSEEERKSGQLARETVEERFRRILRAYEQLCAAEAGPSKVEVTGMPPLAVSHPAAHTGNGDGSSVATPTPAPRRGRTRTTQ